jgi:hypothetical protein
MGVIIFYKLNVMEWEEIQFYYVIFRYPSKCLFKYIQIVSVLGIFVGGGNKKHDNGLHWDWQDVMSLSAGLHY